MMPNIHFHEHLMFDRAQEWQREIEKQHLLACLPESRSSHFRHLVGRLGTLFMTLGTHMKQLEQRNEPSV